MIKTLGGELKKLFIILSLLLSLSMATVTDIDGNVYETVQIGEQLWMKDNLKVTHYRNGDAIPTGLDNNEWSSTSDGAYAVYDDDPANAEIYGNLYNWYAVADDREVCPEGWHIPSDNEWTVLTDYLGGNSIAGGKMKEEGHAHWNYYSDEITEETTNESGFTGVPAGLRSGVGYFEKIGEKAYFWFSSLGTFQGEVTALLVQLSYNNNDFLIDNAHWNSGFSIRCIAESIIEGCTNPNATNYDETANVDDGSCCVELWGECYNIEETTTINLRWSNLTGEIPSQIGLLENLEKLFLLDNNLSGEIPQEIGNLTNLTHLEFSENNLSGEIPSSIGNLTDLEELYAYDNQLSGEIPFSIGNLTNLKILELQDNQFTGSIPSSIGNLIDLHKIFIYNNQFSGELPSEIYNLVNLEYFWVHYNFLSGSIDEQLCNFYGIDSQYETIKLDNNSFCRPYPECLSPNQIGSQNVSECPAQTILVPENFATIQEAIDFSIDGDTILVSAGTYYENINFNGKNISLIGEDRETTIIDGGQNGSVVKFINGETNSALLTEFTIQNGSGTSIDGNWEGGGGIICYNSEPILMGLIVQNNSAISGGGIYIKNSNYVQLKDLIVSYNDGSGGGGINISNSSPFFLNVVIENNIGLHGGGLEISISDNSNPTFESISIINNNGGGNAGGINIENSDNLILNNALIYGNTAPYGAGGLFVNGGTPSIINSTIINNSGIWGVNIATGMIKNCIISGNSGSEGMIFSYDDSYNITYSNIQSYFEGDGNIDSDPQFTDPNNGDYTLQSSSPCIDAGDPESDLDPDGTRADMGAYYYHQDPVQGDINGDFQLDILDVVLGVNIIIELIEYTDEQYLALDYNGDGNSNIVDLVQMVNAILYN